MFNENSDIPLVGKATIQSDPKFREGRALTMERDTYRTLAREVLEAVGISVPASE